MKEPGLRLTLAAAALALVGACAERPVGKGQVEDVQGGTRADVANVDDEMKVILEGSLSLADRCDRQAKRTSSYLMNRVFEESSAGDGLDQAEMEMMTAAKVRKDCVEAGLPEVFGDAESGSSAGSEGLKPSGSKTSSGGSDGIQPDHLTSTL